MQDPYPENPPTLDYAAPQARRSGFNRARGAVVVALGMCAGLFAAMFLFYSVPGMIWVFTRDNGVDFAGDLFACTIGLLIGLFSLAVSIRWCLGGSRLLRGQTEKR